MRLPSETRRSTGSLEEPPVGTFEILTGSHRRHLQGLHSRQLRAVTLEKALRELNGFALPADKASVLEKLQAEPMDELRLSPPEREYATWIRWNPENQPQGFRRETCHESQ
jgi:hypothetical protein